MRHHTWSSELTPHGSVTQTVRSVCPGHCGSKRGLATSLTPTLFTKRGLSFDTTNVEHVGDTREETWNDKYFDWGNQKEIFPDTIGSKVKFTRAREKI